MNYFQSLSRPRPFIFYRLLENKSNVIWSICSTIHKIIQNPDPRTYLMRLAKSWQSRLTIYLFQVKTFLWKYITLSFSTHSCCNCNNGNDINTCLLVLQVELTANFTDLTSLNQGQLIIRPENPGVIHQQIETIWSWNII